MCPETDFLPNLEFPIYTKSYIYTGFTSLLYVKPYVVSIYNEWRLNNTHRQIDKSNVVGFFFYTGGEG